MARKTEDLGNQEKRLLKGLYLFYQKDQLTDGQMFACNRNGLTGSNPFFRYLYNLDLQATQIK